MKPIYRSYLIEVNLGNTTPGTGQNINIQDYPQLRDIYLCGVMASESNELTKSPSGKTVVSTLTGATITFKDIFNQDIIFNYPLYDLNPVNQSGFYRDFVPFQLQLTKSFITILDATSLNANESFILNILYLTKKDYAQLSKATKPTR
jgi:hypothetical protein